uniref:Tc1-like transposase DDE domain-containing protein n=2 Tax=Photinus pyralis TaxID=7054 RepID=A0A1Y1JY26_PHOPY
MDSTPSTSKANISPVKRRTRLNLGHLSISEKQCILNLYKQILTDDPGTKMVTIVAKIAEAAGIAKSTVYRTIKEYKKTGAVTPSKRSGGRPPLVSQFEESTKTSVRQIIHNFFYHSELPTLDKILKEINSREDLPQMCRSSLYKLMKQINFKYLKRSRKSVLIERDDIIRWRRKYLKAIKQYRNEGRAIYYLDETWLNEGHTKQKVWTDDTIRTRRQAFVEGLSTGLKNPSGKGKRLIILHVGSENGFVNEGLLLFEGRKTSDYHEEMNAEVFEEWFASFLVKIPENAVIVMDNAPYQEDKMCNLDGIMDNIIEISVDTNEDSSFGESSDEGGN